MNRRTFLISSGIAGIGALVSNSASGSAAEPESSAETFSWNTGQLQFQFSIAEGQLRQHVMLPLSVEASRESLQWVGETAQVEFMPLPLALLQEAEVYFPL